MKQSYSTADIEEFAEDLAILASSNNQRHATVANKVEQERGKKLVYEIEHQRLGRIRALDRTESEVRKSFKKLQEEKLSPRTTRKKSASLDDLDVDEVISNFTFLTVKPKDDNRSSSSPDLRFKNELEEKASDKIIRPRSTDCSLKRSKLTPSSSTGNLQRKPQSYGSISLTDVFFRNGIRSCCRSTPTIPVDLHTQTKYTGTGKSRFRTVVNKQINTEENRTRRQANMVLRCFGKSRSKNVETDSPMLLPPIHQQGTRKLVKRDFKKAPNIVVTDADWESIRSCRYVR